MTIAEAHWSFKNRVNRLNSQHNRGLLPAQIDSILNNAQDFYLEHLAQVSRFPFESTQQRLDMISTLVVNGTFEEGLLSPDRDLDSVYEFKTSNLKYPYAHTVRAFGKCGSSDVRVSFIKHDELTDVLRDDFQKPNLGWGRLLGTIKKDSTNNKSSSVYIHGDPEYVLQGIYLDYIRIPKPVFFGGYDSIGYIDCTNKGLADCSSFYKTTDSSVDCELPELFHNLWLDIAVMLFAGQTENPQLYQFIEKKIVSLT